jgi:hypothetical protein
MPIRRDAMVGELGIDTVGVDQRIIFLGNSTGNGALRVYKIPEHGHTYACGGEFGKYVARLCRYYNMAQVALERTGAGVGSLESLLNDSYPAGLIYHRLMAPDQDPVIGWESNEVSRQQLISLLDDVIRQSIILVHDATTIQELLLFTINERGRPAAQKGSHDDCVLALALMVVVMARKPRPLLGGAEPLPASRAAYRQVRPARARSGRPARHAGISASTTASGTR